MPPSMQKKKFLLPKAIYESLPLLYITMGLLVVFTLSSTLALISGAILALMGLLIWQLRRNYRSPYQALTRNLRNHRV